MNWEQMKKNVGSRIQLVPAACRLDEQGRKLPDKDDEWVINDVSNDGVRISNTRTGHTTTLGKDHIHHYTSNPDGSQGGIRRGFLTLNVQLFMQGRGLQIRPNARPGEAVAPPSVEIIESLVDLRYPADSGLQTKLESDGYRIAWCLESRLPRLIEVEKWEVVVERDGEGVLRVFRVKDHPSDQILIKKRIS